MTVVVGSGPRKSYSYCKRQFPISISIRQAVFPVPEDQQTSLFHRNLRRFPGKVIADTQGESGGEGSPVQGVIQPLQRHTLRISPQAEDGNGPFPSRREPESAVFYNSDQIFISRQIAKGPMVAEELEGLEIGDGVVQPGPSRDP